MKKKANLKKKLGQNTAEYIVMLVLVVGGGVAVMSLFSGAIKSRISMATAAITGKTPEYKRSQEAGNKAGTAAAGRAEKASSMSGEAGEDLIFTPGAGTSE